MPPFDCWLLSWRLLEAFWRLVDVIYGGILEASLETVGLLLDTLGHLLASLEETEGDCCRTPGHSWRLAEPSWRPAGDSVVPLEAPRRGQMVSRWAKKIATRMFSSISKGSRGGGPKIEATRAEEGNTSVQVPHSLFQVAQASIQETTWSTQDTGIKE